MQVEITCPGCEEVITQELETPEDGDDLEVYCKKCKKHIQAALDVQVTFTAYDERFVEEDWDEPSEL